MFGCVPRPGRGPEGRRPPGISQGMPACSLQEHTVTAGNEAMQLLRQWARRDTAAEGNGVHAGAESEGVPVDMVLLHDCMWVLFGAMYSHATGAYMEEACWELALWAPGVKQGKQCMGAARVVVTNEAPD
jgi:hypothetical protein